MYLFKGFVTVLY